MDSDPKRQSISRKRMFAARFSQLECEHCDENRFSSPSTSTVHIRRADSSQQCPQLKRHCLVNPSTEATSSSNFNSYGSSNSNNEKGVQNISNPALRISTNAPEKNVNFNCRERKNEEGCLTTTRQGNNILSRRATMRCRHHSDCAKFNSPRLNLRFSLTSPCLNSTEKSSSDEQPNIYTKISGLSKISSSTPVLHETPLPLISNRCKNLNPSILLKHGEAIQDYIIFGSGFCAKAINTKTDKVFIAMVYKHDEAMKIYDIMNRLDNASQWYHEDDCEELSNCILHPNSEIVEDSKNRYIMFVPSERESVHTYAAEKGDEITEEEVIFIFRQVVRIVNFCHTIGIVVRDMKPKKLLICNENGNRKIRLDNVHDAVLLDEPFNDKIRERFVSPAYVPPEVLTLNRNSGTYSGNAADIWGLGVLLYMLFIGKYPFYDSTPAGVFRKIKRAKISFPICHISQKSRDLITALLKRNPEERITAKSLNSGNLYPETNFRCRIKEQMEYYDKRDKMTMLLSILAKTSLTEEERSLPQYELQRRRDILLNMPLKRQLAEKVKELRTMKKEIIPQTMILAAQNRKNIESGSWTTIMKKIARRRVNDINALLQRQVKQLRISGTEHLTKKHRLSISDVPLELLFPAQIYPPSRSYDPQQDPLHSMIYNLLRANNHLNFQNIHFLFRTYCFDDVSFSELPIDWGKMTEPTRNIEDLPVEQRENTSTCDLKENTENLQIDYPHVGEVIPKV